MIQIRDRAPRRARPYLAWGFILLAIVAIVGIVSTQFGTKHVSETGIHTVIQQSVAEANQTVVHVLIQKTNAPMVIIDHGGTISYSSPTTNGHIPVLQEKEVLSMQVEARNAAMSSQSNQ